MAEELERNKATVGRWVRRGYLPAHKITGEYRIRRQDFEEWLEEQRVKPPA